MTSAAVARAQPEQWHQRGHHNPATPPDRSPRAQGSARGQDREQPREWHREERASKPRDSTGDGVSQTWDTLAGATKVQGQQD